MTLTCEFCRYLWVNFDTRIKAAAALDAALQHSPHWRA